MPFRSTPYPQALLSWLGAWFLAATAAPGQVSEAESAAPSPNITVSASEQFQVIGGKARIRGIFASFAEREKAHFLRTLSQHDDPWHHLILIRLSGQLTDPPTGPGVDWNINQFGTTFSLEIRVRLHQDFSKEAFRNTLLHMLMFERALRDVEVPVTDQLIPRWIRIGLPGALRLRREGRPSGFFRTMFRLNLVTPAEEILSATKEDIDAVSRSVYAASASGFVLMLLDQPEGPQKLARMIHGFGGAHQAQGHSMVARHFPALIGSAERLEKQWVLYCSKLASPQVLEFLTPEATASALSEALQVRFLEFESPETIDGEGNDKKRNFLTRFWKKDGPTVEATNSGSTQSEDREEESTPAASPADTEPPTRVFEGTLNDFERILPRQDRAEILAPVRQALLELGFRSFPLYRPLINDYLQLVGDLLGGQSKGIEKRLSALDQERDRLTRLLQDIDTFMDEFEREEMRKKSGLFDAYLQRVKVIESSSGSTGDPISSYLDEVERALR